MSEEGRSRRKLSGYKTKERTRILILVPTIKHFLYFSHLLNIAPLSKISSTWLVAIVINIYVQQIEWWMHLGCRWSNKICQQEQPQFFFCFFLSWKPLSFAGAFQIQVWWAFHPQMIVCFEHINLWILFSEENLEWLLEFVLKTAATSSHGYMHFMWRGRSINKEWQISFLFSAQALMSFWWALSL